MEEKIKVMTDYSYMQDCAHGIPEMEEVVEEMKKRGMTVREITKPIPASSLPSAEEVREAWEKEEAARKARVAGAAVPAASS